MPTSTKARRTEAGADRNPWASSVSAFNPEMRTSLAEAGSAYLRGVASLNREIATFITRRLEHDAELARALGRCRDWQEANELQQSWFREACEEYAVNAKVITELTNRLLTDTFSPMQSWKTGGSDSDGE